MFMFIVNLCKRLIDDISLFFFYFQMFSFIFKDVFFYMLKSKLGIFCD